MSVPVSLDTPARVLGDRQHRKLDKLDGEDVGARVVGWDERRGGPLVSLAVFPGEPYVIDRRGQLRPR